MAKKRYRPRSSNGSNDSSSNNGSSRGPNRSGGGGNRRRRSSGSGGGGYRPANKPRRSAPDQNYEPVEFDDAELAEGVGLLELHPNGYGFLRSPENNYSRERSDPFVPGTMIEKFGLRGRCHDQG